MNIVLLLLSSFLLAGCSVLGKRTAEEAQYTVLRSEGVYEVRQYQPMILAETAMEGDYRSTSGKAFSKLASYIFGGNKADSSIDMTTPVIQEQRSEEIAMTAPVIQQKSGEKWVTAFVMPQKYTMETIPKPLDEDIVLREVPERRVAAIRYSGLHSEKNILKYSEKLNEWIAQNGYRPVSGPRMASFDPPWTLPFLRRNEVHIDIE
ncbi:heme-binding protein [Prosthecochloris marina]|uniref:Heme-binding protein n=1 Tax=Prosthecochloris marina TaxID=2017681 RepID=A0A317T866_9CHLB|nr:MULTISPECIES: heme-binding protein [Prosthecochloris]PWW82884.1 heme-binding protein [Prosthecochloris marina]UZJ41625.1 heme-binding protein [Prosthecochloris sp. SCSIO W1101]